MRLSMQKRKNFKRIFENSENRSKIGGGTSVLPTVRKHILCTADTARATAHPCSSTSVVPPTVARTTAPFVLIVVRPSS